MEGLQAGLEKLAMKPKGSPLKLNETEIKEVKDMADSQSTAMRRYLEMKSVQDLEKH